MASGKKKPSRDGACSGPARSPGIGRLPTDVPVPCARNSCTHPPDRIGQVAAPIRVSGFSGPVLFAGGTTVIAGAGPCADGAGDGHGCCAVPFGLPVRVPGQPEQNWTRARQPAQ